MVLNACLYIFGELSLLVFIEINDELVVHLYIFIPENETCPSVASQLRLKCRRLLSLWSSGDAMTPRPVQHTVSSS